MRRSRRMPLRMAAGDGGWSKPMNEEQKKWSSQYTSNIGGREFLRLGCAIGSWILILVGLTIVFGFVGLSSKFTGLLFGTILVISFGLFPFIARSWGPGYSLVRRILGNQNLPEEPYPRSTAKIPRPPLAWWGYLLAIWHWLLLLVILFILLKWYLQ